MGQRMSAPTRLICSNRQLYKNESLTSQRTGIITFWAIVSIPIFLCLLCFVLEIGNLWLGRIQLKNALESGALAAVKNWGDAGGGDTQISRQVGNQFTNSMLVNGSAVNLSTIDGTLNYNAMNGANQNGACSGVFVFGAIIDNDPAFTFDSCSAAGCGPPFSIVMDSSSNGNLGSNPNNQWGISLQPTPQTRPGLYVTRVVISLPLMHNGDVPVFDFGSDTPDISSFVADNISQNKVGCSAGNIDCDPVTTGTQGGGSSQGDVYGVDPNQITFSLLTPGAQYGDDGMGGRLECVAVGVPAGNLSGKILAIDFCNPDVMVGCDTFEAGDHIRFGATVTNAGVGNFDGDDIGDMNAEVTICYSDGSFQQGTFTDTTDNPNGGALNCSNVTFASWGECFPGGLNGSTGRHGMSVAGLAPDQPVPPGSAANNNGQSLVSFNSAAGSTGIGFAVRAQATYVVPSICRNIFGIPIGPFNVTAKADAIYDCTTRRPRLYHLDNNEFNCSAPCP